MVAAEETLAGQFVALGHTWPKRDPSNLFPAELWRLDPATGGLWPGSEHYCFDIPYRHERALGDIKCVWEINRLQFLQPLAAKVALDGDGGGAALAAVETAIQSWFDANPPFRGIAWNSGIEVALRAISLLVVSSLVGERLSGATSSRLRSILAASLYWLKRFPSRFSSANNHLIAEAAAEYLIGLAMPDLAGAAAAAAHALRVLDAEALKQIFPDGVPAEQSPTYGAFSAELLLVAHEVEPIAPATLKRLDAFADFIAWLADSDCRVPAIGDDDEGFVLAVGVRSGRYAADVASCVATIGERRGLKTFATGGYSVVRHNGWHLVFDHGPLGYLSIAAHGHADALSFTLARNGRGILVDPGTYLYHAGADWRDWFRSTAAHNTLSVSNANQSSMTGPFNWSKKANVRLETSQPGETWRLVASHDGYEASFAVRHRRSITTEQGTIIVRDQLIGQGAPRRAEISFQFAPSLEVDVGDIDCRVIENGKAILAFQFSAVGKVMLHRGGEPADGGGWVSPAFGKKMPASRLVWSGEVGEAGVTTLIKPLEGNE
ncbi:heparinase II/III family protein [Bradyrhizobium amphicarpaeae]|nr:heparinase II/III family protein [Bradyrhizobium amphicarpaeae]